MIQIRDRGNQIKPGRENMRFCREDNALDLY
jgi:hypothetical protein